MNANFEIYLLNLNNGNHMLKANSLASGTEIGKITEQIMPRISKNS
jgi:hypothetical protein